MAIAWAFGGGIGLNDRGFAAALANRVKSVLKREFLTRMACRPVLAARVRHPPDSRFRLFFRSVFKHPEGIQRRISLEENY